VESIKTLHDISPRILRRSLVRGWGSGGVYEPELCPGSIGVNDQGETIYPDDYIKGQCLCPDTSGDIAPDENIEPKPPTVTEGDTPNIQADTASTDSLRAGSGSGNIYDIGPGTRIRPNTEPGSVIRQFDVNGEIRSVGLYDNQGNIVERIDVTGRPHAGIEPPHVVRYDRNEYPGGVGYAKSFAGGANIYEKEIVEFLKWFW